ncbi:Asp-tRNA(Asn)/Glu-tRNA(Gln) amidotransferase subunit GatB [Candidatus Kuenenbacteria bacterium HGW-Kuenenbacteria-1]|uniref:Aspartyl/glutamyl-tRNA(Asn/Gln) amidotransferase subunit B n=1 Tax=Candidatus Kuenenbacteria bacterium HGW-Kuenenbacteria-1 TaxID=2013812 RepID=A0A2N1UP65_9BACT|nr:MAG: Asp-tRNA(Asn)/Glu-tRNA(Gln) amidotransferase subunit GatB [Candidatus Kuenenbacteria bacterium HGW-Kuenenbacteria-1]
MYLPIIGLEIHIQLKTKSKMFCSCDNSGENQPPNTTICPVCMGFPGSLPVINRQAVEWTILMGLALDGKIAEFSKFDRKNYFYPDLPKGYQISQYDFPFVQNGYLIIPDLNKKIRINRIHLEEDAAKLQHSQNKKYSLVDFNRSSTPLMEVVTEPDFRTSQEAKNFLQELRLIARYQEISDADMEKGHLRCDANISLMPLKELDGINDFDAKKFLDKLYPKTEIKNLNSFKAVEKALEYEIRRQTKLWEQKNPPKEQTTRGWDENKEITVEQRTKEEAHDYRYFPEPDLPPLYIKEKKDDTNDSSKIILEQIRLQLKELPQQKRIRFMEEYGFTLDEVKILTENCALSYYTEQVISELREWFFSFDKIQEKQREKVWQENKEKLHKLAASWLINRLAKYLSNTKIKIPICLSKNDLEFWKKQSLKISPENFAELLCLIYKNKINQINAQKVLEKMFKTGADPSDIMREQGLEQVSDEIELENLVKKVIENNLEIVKEYKNGKESVLQFLIGQAMKESKGKANPQIIMEILKKIIIL